MHLRTWLGDRLHDTSQWLGQRWCGLVDGHHFLVTRDDARLVLECCWCGFIGSGGWNLREE